MGPEQSRPAARSAAPEPDPPGAGSPATAERSLEGVARDASTILDVVRAFEREGFGGQLATRAGGQIECLTCRRVDSATRYHVQTLRRLEGASDPDDMLAVAAVVCPQCSAGATLLLNYGPSATPEDSAVLQSLERPPPPEPDRVERDQRAERGEAG